MTQPLCDQLTAKGEPCQKKAVTGSTRCAAHLGTAHRKTNWTTELEDALVAMLKAGNYIGVALRAVSLPSSTYSDWMRRGEIGEEPFASFREKIDRALAEGEIRNVAQIAAAARENWQAAAWILERAYPERWARVSTRHRLPTQPPEERPEPPADLASDPFHEVDELAEKRRSRTL